MTDPVFQYTLVLCYPNGRYFHLQEESKQLLALGQQFDAFGRRWTIERELRPKDLRTLNHSPSNLQAFACSPVPLTA